MTDAIVAGSSATTWYMSDGGAVRLQVAYLPGTNRLPTVRTGFLRGGRFGMWFDVEHWLGVAPVDFRGIVKNTA